MTISQRSWTPPDEWIVQRSGIKTRYWVDKGDTGVSLAREASQKALKKAGLAASDIDCIIYCTCTPDHFEPATASFCSASWASPIFPPSTSAISAAVHLRAFDRRRVDPHRPVQEHSAGRRRSALRAGSTKRRVAATRPCCSVTAPGAAVPRPGG